MTTNTTPIRIQDGYDDGTRDGFGMTGADLALLRVRLDAALAAADEAVRQLADASLTISNAEVISCGRAGRPDAEAAAAAALPLIDDGYAAVRAGASRIAAALVEVGA